MAIKVGDKLRVKDYDDNWVDGVVYSRGPKYFVVDAMGEQLTYHYHEHKESWVKASQSDSKP